MGIPQFRPWNFGLECQTLNYASSAQPLEHLERMGQLVKVPSLVELEQRPQLRRQDLLPRKRAYGRPTRKPRIVDAEVYLQGRIMGIDLPRVDLDLQPD